MGIDALTTPWLGMWAFVFHPIPLILSLEEDKGGRGEIDPSSSLVAYEIVDTRVDRTLKPPWTLPVQEKLLAQPRLSILDENPGIHKLHAWRLLHKVSKMSDSQRRWQTELLGVSPMLLL